MFHFELYFSFRSNSWHFKRIFKVQAKRIIPYCRQESNAKYGLFLYGIYGISHASTSGNVSPTIYSHLTYVFGNGL